MLTHLQPYYNFKCKPLEVMQVLGQPFLKIICQLGGLYT